MTDSPVPAPTGASTPSGASAPAGASTPGGGAAATGRLARLRPFVVPLVAILAFLLVRALTADDGTHGIRTGQCVAAVGTNDFRTVDCGDASSLGSVTYIEKNVPTDEAAALRLCSAHGAQGAFTSADAAGGAGTVICVADPR
ncbi:hypothetical protein [Terrabacter carboxydivorans]|uniref:Uncharacterized protein n=1 Tax=Terrabacter carboxydivorans TaxID=619730 RepID=A0ABN3LTD4_9MICO